MNGSKAATGYSHSRSDVVDRSRRAWNLLSFAGVAALLFATFANYALQELGHDEGMYLGASFLTIDHSLYTKVGYFQAPNLPLLLSSFFAWTNVTHFLMWGRIVTYFHHTATLILLGAVSWHFTRSSAFTFFFLIALGLNGFLYGAGYSIDNTTFASTYLLAGFYTCVRAHDRAWRSMFVAALSGSFVALAAGFKLNYLPCLACFVLVVAFFSPRRALASFLGGSIVGLVPSLYLAITRAPAFWLNNVTWHRRLLAMNVEELGVRGTIAGFFCRYLVLSHSSSLARAPGARGSPLRYSAIGKDIASLQQTRSGERVDVIGNPAIVYGVEGALSLAPSAATGAFVRGSSPIFEPRSSDEDAIATYDGLSYGDAEMVIATVEYVMPRSSVAPGDWCTAARLESSFDALLERWCDSGYRREVMGEGPARVVVFYR